MKIALFGQEYKTKSLQYIVDLINVLTEKSIEIVVYAKILHLVKENLDVELATFNSYYDLPLDVNYMISIGGDGTMLRATKYIKDKNIPVVGINTGRMGFLANIHKDFMVEAIDDLIAGKYNLSTRSILEVQTENDTKTFYALNEIAVNGKNTTSMISIDTYLNTEYLNTYWADGLIIATPTGSTGYSLSCNGPIIAPEVKSFIITPIAPHNLSIRPLVIHDELNVRLKISSRETKFLLSMDSKVINVKTGTDVFVKKADFSIQMIELNNQSFIKTLREKLLWGKDTRN